jgi:hypothetical protein
MTIYQYCIGTINMESVLRYPNIAAWAAQWLHRAEQAQRHGKELVVFEISKNELTYASMIVPGDLPGEAPSLPTDPDFINELMAPVGDME